MSQNESIELMTVGEVADFLCVPKSWVYERTRSLGIPCRRIGRLVRIPRAELLTWIDQQQPTPKLEK